jgi:hypothetical protein
VTSVTLPAGAKAASAAMKLERETVAVFVESVVGRY